MSTRAADQQRKQRQKEFKERKENQARLKAAAKDAKANILKKDDDIDGVQKT